MSIIQGLIAVIFVLVAIILVFGYGLLFLLEREEERYK